MRASFPSFPQILQDKLIPWSKTGAADRIIVARPQMQKYTVPSKVTLTNSPVSEKRVAVRGRRLYNNTRLITTELSTKEMHELTVPRFITVVEGEVNFQAGNYLLGCRNADYIYLPPGILHPGNVHNPHYIHPQNSNETCTLLWIGKYRGSIQCWLTRYTAEERQHHPTENYLFLKNQPRHLFDLLTQELETEPKDRELRNNLLTAFWRSLNREVEAKNYLQNGPIVRDNKVTQDESTFVAQLEEYISSHLSQRLTLEETARKLYTSRTQFAQRIRQETGQTFIEFLTAYRLKEAKTLLVDSDWAINTIANFVGFIDPSYFYKVFRSETQLTPLQYRQKHRELTTTQK